MEFFVRGQGIVAPSKSTSCVYLYADNWNDYSFVTLFQLSVYDPQGKLYEIGNTKIGFKGQTTDTPTYKKIPAQFPGLSGEFFSLGQSTDFYRKMGALPSGIGKDILTALRDIAVVPNIVDEINEERVLSVSLLRDTSI